MTAVATGSGSARSEMVVIRSGATILKGYLDDPIWNPVEKLLRLPPAAPPASFRIRHHDSNTVDEVPTENLTALFYVKTFDGDPRHRDINFHAYVPTVDGIWMRLEFDNGEIMEGLVYNSLHYLLDPGFFLLPTDPESNNNLVYVMKQSLVDHRILGIRRL